MSTSTRATGRKRAGSHLNLASGRLPADVLLNVVKSLQDGGVVIFPTETVYGIGASAFSSQGIRKIYQLKGRKWNKPLALLVPSLEAAAPLVETIPPEAFRLAKAFWPGPMTLVLAASPLGKLVTGGLATIGVRVPDHPVALAILKAVGVPLATTSVNRSGEKPATSGLDSSETFWFEGGMDDRRRGVEIKEASSVVDLSFIPFTS